MSEVVDKILKICEERHLGPNRMDRKHIIDHNNETLKMIKEVIESVLVK